MGNLIYNIAISENTRYYCNGQMYNIWHNMIKRCYSGLNCYKAYIDCTVSENWLKFENFADWFKLNYVEGFELDKDILFKGNKIYGPDTCCFVPRQINSLILTNKSRRGLLPIGIKQVGSKFAVSLTKYKKKQYIGTYLTIEEAFENYKFEKQKYIREIADFWKEKISDNVYQSLINYQIEITD